METIAKLTRHSIWAAVLLATPALAWADLESGPAIGEKVGEVKVAAVTGSQAGKELDYVAERGDKPTIYVFVQADAFDRPMARFLKKLDGEVKQAAGDAEVVAIWLTDDQQKSKDYLPRAQSSLQFQNTALTVHAGDKGGPMGWGLHVNARLTAVVVNQGKSAAKFGFDSVNETVAGNVLDALKKAAEQKPRRSR